MQYSGGGENFDASRIVAFQQIIAAEFDLNPLLVAIPPVVVIGLVLLKCPAIPGMVAGTLSASVIAMCHA